MGRRLYIINQYAKTPATGASNRHYELARGLAERGHDVTVVAAAFDHLVAEPVPVRHRYTVEQQGDGFRFAWVRVPPFRGAVSAGRVRAWLSFARALPGLPRVVGDAPHTILYSSPSLIGWLGAAWLARRTGARLVFEVRDIWPLSLVEIAGVSPRHPFVRLLQRIEDMAYRRSHAVISNLPHAVEHMAERGLNRDRFTWIPNGCRLSNRRDEPLDGAVAEQLPDRPFLVGYTGTVGRANEVSALVGAASQLQHRKDIGFVVVGDGTERAALERRAAQEGLSNIAFVPPIPKSQIQSLLSRLQACYVGLQPQPLFRFGVSPNKLFDYMLAARPILYGIDSGAYRPVSEAGAGLDVIPGDEAALARAIERMADMPVQERRAMGERARAALDDYDYARLALRLEAVVFPGERG